MARRGNSLLYSLGSILCDSGALALAVLTAHYFRFYAVGFLPFIPPPTEIPSVTKYYAAYPIALAVFLLTMRSTGLYHESLAFKKVVRIGSIFKAVFNGILILFAMSAMYRTDNYSRVFLVLLLPLLVIYISLFRKGLIALENHIRKIQGKIKKILLVGEGSKARELVTGFKKMNIPNTELLGTVNCYSGDETEPGVIPTLGRVDEFSQLLSRHDIDEVIITTVKLESSLLSQIISECDRQLVQCYIVPDIFEVLTSKVEVTSLGGISLLGLQKFPLDNGLNRLMKRVLDIVGALTGLCLGLPFFIFMAVIIKLTSKGPVFFKQVRCQEDGQEFQMIKFRTMKENAEKESGPVWAKEGDDRCTAIGRIMRRWNIDEIPQLWNVLAGEMSLVGPRPERPHFISQFKFDIPNYMKRHHIRPGMTGWAQVNGWRGNTSLEERIKYDLYYIENWSLWFDIKIIFMTFTSFKNAY